jgi:hypothetical protein
VQVHCNEGAATRMGPAPCIGIREGDDEASAGEHTGQPLSHESFLFQVPTLSVKAQGNTGGCASASTRTTWRGRRISHVCTLLVREPGDLGFDQPQCNVGMVRIGKARSHSR